LVNPILIGVFDAAGGAVGDGVGVGFGAGAGAGAHPARITALIKMIASKLKTNFFILYESPFFSILNYQTF